MDGTLARSTPQEFTCPVSKTLVFQPCCLSSGTIVSWVARMWGGDGGELLVGSFTYCLCSPLFKEDSYFDEDLFKGV